MMKMRTVFRCSPEKMGGDSFEEHTYDSVGQSYVPDGKPVKVAPRRCDRHPLKRAGDKVDKKGNLLGDKTSAK